MEVPVGMAVQESVGDLNGENRYVMGRRLGGGSYADVFTAFDKKRNRDVAVKKMKREVNYGKEFEIATDENVTLLREVQILWSRKLNHPNLIKLLDVFPHENVHHLVFELMETDLHRLIRNPSIKLSRADYKSYMQMLLQGLAHCHENSVIHRDLKPDNLLIDFNGELKLADFGVASLCKDEFSTSQVFAKSYRAPELLMGSRRYGPEVDIWAAGCIFAELITGHRLFRVGNVCCGKARTVSEQLIAIFETFGTPSKKQWPGMKSLPEYVKLEYCTAQSYKQLFPRTSKDCRAILQRMFTYDPDKRITAQQALEHRYFTTAPAPTPAHLLPRRAPSQVKADTQLEAKQ